jgi:hypothetical protein
MFRRIVAFPEHVHAAQNTPEWHRLDMFKSWTRFATSCYMTFDIVLLLTGGMRKRCGSRILVYKKEPSSTWRHGRESMWKACRIEERSFEVSR